MDSRFVDVLIVGSGHGGANAAISLRQFGYAGSVAILSREVHAPYERPPLSKSYFEGEKSFERILIRPEPFWTEQDVCLWLGETVVSVDAQARRVKTSAGGDISYRHLIWAAGGEAMRPSIPGLDAINVHVIRSRDDVDGLQVASQMAHRVGVIGGGFIGLETAAVLAKSGKSVTLFEAMPQVLGRMCAEPTARFLESIHRQRGVTVLLGTKIDYIERQADQASGVMLSDGHLVPVDLLIVGTGISPLSEPLRIAGAQGADGVDVDDLCRTSLPDVFAIGDCAAHVNTFADGKRMRIESVQNAIDQAATVARAICGVAALPAPVPWFWSNQFDVKLQTVGLSNGYDDFCVRGDPASGKFSVIYLRAGKIAALDCINSPAVFMQGRALVGRPAPNPLNLLSDPSVSLKAFA